MVLVMARCEAGLIAWRCSRAVLSQPKANRNHQARVHSDQMVLVIVEWEAAGPVAWWPKMLK
jgi:hypothetical protein